ncbi:MAG TPA: energy-coupling factor transporter transmembrane component T [Thermomicrobiales bacterium]|nr:energy-coupling factor transporter transmembrane component T [Thermomicrobiales bacterium]
MSVGMERLDSRAWILWAIAAMVPVLIGRHPLVIGEILVIVVVVRIAWASRVATAGVGWLIRLGMVVLSISVIFNVLTVHAGDRVLARLPESLPVIGGVLTLNALVYGLVSALALFTLLLIGTTTGALLVWMDLFRLLPRRLAPIAVAGSVTWAFLPRTAAAFSQIREAQMMRGHRVRTGRDVLPLVMPLLAGGLERSLTTAEALEARGFGASLTPSGEPQPSSWSLRLGITIALVALLGGSYCLLVGLVLVGITLMLFGGGALAAALSPPRRGSRIPQPTRYHDMVWRREDMIVSAAAVGVLGVTFGRMMVSPAGFRFDPYPALELPGTDLPLMIALSALLLPAMFAPGTDSAGIEGRR